jgi:predicted permease
MRRFLVRLKAFVRRERAEAEMTREIAAHLALMEEDFRASGMDAAAARRAARRAWGGVEQSKELHRDERSFVWLEQILQDLRHVFRSLAKAPGFVAVAGISLALGIGVNVAMFTLLNGVLLKNLAVPDADRIVEPEGVIGEFTSRSFSHPAFRELRQQTGIFTDVVAFASRPVLLDVGGDERRIDMSLVSGSYFAFFGARPEMGRLLDAADDEAEGARAVCVLSYQGWQRHFGGNAGVLGRRIRLDGVTLEVVGVARRDFVGAELQRRYDVWVPTAVAREFTHFPREAANYIWLGLLGRLKPGLTRAEAGARLAAASRGIEDALPKERANGGAVYRIAAAPGGYDSVRGALHDPLLVLMAAVTLVLLVACANLGNLALARSRERAQEFAIKLALGISRVRLLTQLVLESLVVALGGGLIAIPLAFGLTRYLLALYNSGSEWSSLEVAPDGSVLVYALAISVVTALVAGVYPAWQASRADTGAGLRPGMVVAARGNGVRRVLILAQVTLTVVLVFGAGLFASSLGNLKAVNLGYRVDRVLTLRIDKRGPAPQADAGSTAALDSLLGQVRRLPGVERAGYASLGVMTGSMTASTMEVAEPGGGVRKLGSVPFIEAGPGYFSTLGTRILRGRDFREEDRTGPPVAIVNERLAQRIWGREGAVGKRMDAWDHKNVEVIGVVESSKYQEVREKAQSTAFADFDQTGAHSSSVLQVRTVGSAAAVERAVRELVRTGAPGYQVSSATAMELLRDNLIAQDRLLAFLSTLFGALGVALALVGIYGLISYSVSRRTREIGIRLSLGAQRAGVLWLVVRESVALVAAGLAIGLPLGLGLSKFLRVLLYEVSPGEPRGMAATAALILLGTAMAALAPAARAARVDPVRALRAE